MIITLAGRRVDAVDAKEPRFPNTNVDVVRQRIRAMLQAQKAAVLVSAAACGADLLALSEAGSLGLRRRIVLPFEREKFRSSSVTDRPGDWGPLYDRILDEVEKQGDLVVVHTTSGHEGFIEGSHAIVDEAISLGRELGAPVTAALVWNGKSRGADDVTAEFGVYALGKSIPVVEVMTL